MDRACMASPRDLLDVVIDQITEIPGRDSGAGVD